MDGLTPTAVVTFIQGVGFPVAVAAYLLIVMNRSLRELTSAIQAVHALLAQHLAETRRARER
jgi:hypothetical protein